MPPSLGVAQDPFPLFLAPRAYAVCACEPRIVSQQYLGTAEEVMARLSGTATGEPARSQHKQFGDLAAVWSMLERLDVAGVIDQAVPRYANAAASVGTYIALAIA